MIFALIECFVKVVNERRENYIDPIGTVVELVAESTGFTVDEQFTFEDVLKIMSKYNWD